jgi:hypothetical protein
MSKTRWMTGTATLALVAAIASTAAQAQHHPRTGYFVAPTPYVQQVPPQRVWVPGHWEWNGHRNAWVNGYYQDAQPVYVQPYGIARGRDLDRDGVPDRFDRDRDGDGVPNRYDNRPDNPWRR